MRARRIKPTLRRPCSLPARGSPVVRLALPRSFLAPRKARGWSAAWRLGGRRLAAPARLAIDALATRRSTCGDFKPPAPCFRARTRPHRGPRSGRLPPPFVRAASSHQRQPVLVRADGSAGGSRAQACEACPRAPRNRPGRTRLDPDRRDAASPAPPRARCSTSGSPLEAPLASRQWDYIHRFMCRSRGVEDFFLGDRSVILRCEPCKRRPSKEGGH